MSNGKYDVIKPGAVNLSPAEDWETVAIKEIGAAENRKLQNKQLAEGTRRFDETMAFNKDKSEKDDWNLMIEQAETPAQKKIIAHAGVMAGHLPAASIDVYDNAAARDETEKGLLKGYYSADDASKVDLWPKLRDTLIENNSPRLTNLEQDAKIRKSNVENKEMIDMMTSQYGDVFSPQLKSLFESKGALTDSQLNMATKMLETSLTTRAKTRKERYDLAQSLIGMQTKGEMPSQEQINTVTKANMLGYKLLQSLETGGYDPKDDTTTLPYPKLEERDKDITGKNNTFDAMSDERKSAEFKRTLEKIIPGGQEAWDNMEKDEQAEKGKEIINIINEKSYTQAPKVAMFGGSGEITDLEFKGEESITDEAVNERYELILKKKGVVGKRRKMATKKTLDNFKAKARKELEQEMMKKSKSRLSKIKAESIYDPDIGGA